MKVRIVCYEDVNRWILGKFAKKMHENLSKMGIDCDIANVPDKKADINHHIIYGNYNGEISGIDSLMITHIDTYGKAVLLKRQLENAKIGVCMSNESMINLTSLGIPRERLCYVNPAHDGVIRPRPYVVGITCRVQNDGRKREYMLKELAYYLKPGDFSFKIMGEYWEPYVQILIEQGFDVEYYNTFEYSKYIQLIPSFDYYLYMGMDEGQMGFIDALAAGVKTIVTSQGYHLDVPGGITYPFKTLEELKSVFNSIIEERNKLVNSISSWNWYDYTQKHLDIWEYLLAKERNISYIKQNRNYDDGINSVFEFSKKRVKKNYKNLIKLKIKLIYEQFRQKKYLLMNKDRGL